MSDKWDMGLLNRASTFVDAFADLLEDFFGTDDENVASCAAETVGNGCRVKHKGLGCLSIGRQCFPPLPRRVEWDLVARSG